MWAVLVGIISILLFVIYSHVKAKLTPTQEELAKEILCEFKADRDSGIEYSKIFLAKFIQFDRENPDKLNKNQMVALKMCYEYKIFEKVFMNEAS